MKNFFKRTGSGMKRSHTEMKCIKLQMFSPRTPVESESRFVLTKRNDMLFIGDQQTPKRKKKISREANAETQETLDANLEENCDDSSLISEQCLKKCSDTR